LYFYVELFAKFGNNNYLCSDVLLTCNFAPRILTITEMKKILFPIIIVYISILCGCGSTNNDNVVYEDHFTKWNACEAITTLKAYVEDVTNPSSKNYIKEEDRIATFDMDGTFVGELYPTYFEYNLLEYRVLDDPAYKDKAPDDVKETAQEIRDFVRNGSQAG